MIGSLRDRLSPWPGSWLDTHTAEVLGWSSDETAFLLGLQVVHAAEVLLVLVGRGGGSPVELALVLRDGLVGFVESARVRGGNVSWIREGERVLGGAGEGYSWESI